MAVALTITVKYPQYARTVVMMVMKNEMMQRMIADPGNIIRSMADAATRMTTISVVRASVMGRR